MQTGDYSWETSEGGGGEKGLGRPGWDLHSARRAWLPRVADHQVDIVVFESGHALEPRQADNSPSRGFSRTASAEVERNKSLRI